LSDLQVGADGALYVMKLIPATGRPSGLYRIQPTTPTSAPSASAASLGVVCTPNPALSTTGTTLRWSAAPGEAWQLRILDAAGRVVRSAEGSGTASWRWDARAADGRRLAAGVYLLCVSSEGRTTEGKVVLLR
jgi:hypothetical protein